MRGATCPGRPVFPSKVFQSTLPCGERPRSFTVMSMVVVFQSTLPCGERLPGACAAFNQAPVSIHAPVRGATVNLQLANFKRQFDFFPRSCFFYPRVLSVFKEQFEKIIFLQTLSCSANLPVKSCELQVRKRSNKQRAFLVQSLFSTHMLNSVLPIGAQIIEPQAVLFWINLGN